MKVKAAALGPDPSRGGHQKTSPIGLGCTAVKPRCSLPGCSGGHTKGMMDLVHMEMDN